MKKAGKFNDYNNRFVKLNYAHLVDVLFRRSCREFLL